MTAMATNPTARVLVYASRRALNDSASLFGGAVVETLVAEAICNGKKTGKPVSGLPTPRGDQRLVFLGGDIVALIERRARRLGSGSCWYVLRLVQQRTRA